MGDVLYLRIIEVFYFREHSPVVAAPTTDAVCLTETGRMSHRKTLV